MRPQKFFYGTLIGLGVLVVGGAGGYYWASSAIHSKTMALQQRLASEVAIDDQISQLVELKKTYQKLQPIIPLIDAALPQSKQQSVVALQLQQLAANAGMSLPSVSFSGTSTLPAPTSQTIKSGNVLALPVSFQLTGTYDQMQAFLRSIEQLNRYTGVTSLSISHKDDKAKTLSFNINVNVYVKP